MRWLSFYDVLIFRWNWLSASKSISNRSQLTFDTRPILSNWIHTNSPESRWLDDWSVWWDRFEISGTCNLSLYQRLCPYLTSFILYFLHFFKIQICLIPHIIFRYFTLFYKKLFSFYFSYFFNLFDLWHFKLWRSINRFFKFYNN